MCVTGGLVYHLMDIDGLILSHRIWFDRIIMVSWCPVSLSIILIMLVSGRPSRGMRVKSVHLSACPPPVHPAPPHAEVCGQIGLQTRE